jgi:Fe-S-cluster-containing dehydrogenase component
MNNTPEWDLEQIRKKIASQKGIKFWRTLQELADSKEFRKHLESDLPRSGEWIDRLDRRRLLQLIGSFFAISGLTSCSGSPPRKIVPYVYDPVGIIPGKPNYYATAMPLSGYGKGVLVESHMGRPTKIEGNPQHPASLGATDIFAQASILSLYNADRARAVTFDGKISSWTAFSQAMKARLEEQTRKKGAGLRILTETITSPAIAAQIQAILQRHPEAKWHQFEPINGDNAREGSLMAFGRDVHTYYRLADAKVIFSLDSDFLTRGPAWLRYSREWATGRRHHSNAKGMNRLYVVESSPSCTGAVADNKLTLHAGEIESFGRAVARALGLQIPADSSESRFDPKWVDAISQDLLKSRGACLVVPGEFQPGTLHALAHAMNQHLGNFGETVIHTDPVEANPVHQIQSLRQLAEALQNGAVDLLFILGGNPAYDAPADIEFSNALRKASTAIHLSPFFNETSARCRWHIPENHYLESWSDIRAYDGTVTIIQPLIAPLFNGRTPHEFLALIQGDESKSPLEMVKGYWRSQHASADFDDFWKSSLQNGVMPNTSMPLKSVSIKQDVLAIRSQPASSKAMEIIFRPDPSIYDGQFAENGWLQELPKPLTKATWNNTAMVSPKTAVSLGFNLDELSESHQKGLPCPVVELQYRERTIEAPLFVTFGHPDDSITVHLGYGRSVAGITGSGHGYNAFNLRFSEAPYFDQGLRLHRTGKKIIMPTTQHHFTMAGRDVVRALDIEDFIKNPDILKAKEEKPPVDESLNKIGQWQYKKYKWAMTVDLSRCIGCNSCIVACEAENNTPVIGEDQIGFGREMQWLRIDCYFSGDPERPDTHFQPVPCMQCELAPCELVCPTHATNHSSEGINQMVYNRCVGTRFCSNNCPYKVRRFNFLQYSSYVLAIRQPSYNPDVTVRTRGVMEKCTYCIQRIQEAKITASKENRRVKDGEVMTACQQACPTQVFAFGDLNAPDSEVRRKTHDPLNYSLLSELNTQPRTTYLAALKNSNPKLALRGE